MTIASTTIATSGSTGNGATTVFSFTFSVEAYGAVSQAQQIEVIKETIASGAETILTLTTDYTTSFNADQNSNPGGSITMVSAPSSAYRIWIRLSPSFVQATDYQSQGGFLMETVEDQADQHSRQILWLRDNVRRAPRAGVQAGSSFSGEITGDLTPGYMIGLNASGTGYQWLDPSTGLPAGVSYLSAATGSDELTALQAIIDAMSAAGGGVLYAAPRQTYILTGRLTLKDNVTIDLNGSKFKFTGANDGIDTESVGWIRNGFISVEGVASYVGPMFKVDDASGYSRTSSLYLGFENLWLYGSAAGASALGTCVKLTSSSNGITNLRFHNFRILNFSKGIHLTASGSGWVNANFFSQFSIYGCINHIYLDTDATDGNSFIDYSIQPNTDTAIASRAIYCVSDYNIFIGRTWDWGTSGSSTAHEFDATKCINNILIDSAIGRQYVLNGPGQYMAEAYTILSANATGLDDTSAQNIFDAAADTLTVAGSTTYEVEAVVYITRTAGTTSHQVQWLFGGTCAFNAAVITAIVANPTGNALGTPQMKMLTAKAASTITAANTSATEHVMIKLHGIMQIATGGTIIPQIQYTVAPGGAPTFVKESYFRARPIGTSTAFASGPWA